MIKFFSWIDEFEERQMYECNNTYPESYFEMNLLENILKQIEMKFFKCDNDDQKICDIRNTIIKIKDQQGLESNYNEKFESRLALTNLEFKYVPNRMYNTLIKLFQQGIFSSIIQEVKEKGQDRLAQRLKPKFTSIQSKEFKEIFDYLLTEHAAKYIIMYCIVQQNVMNFTHQHLDFIKNINYLTSSIFDQGIQLVNSLEIKIDFIEQSLMKAIQDTIAEAEIDADDFSRSLQQSIYHSDIIMNDGQFQEGEVEEKEQHQNFDNIDDDILEEIAREYNQEMNQ